jgi:CubicO group peptidase (beta-lactamase class C family)
MKTLLAVLACAGFVGAVRADAIDDYINVEMAHQHVPGLALAIMRHGQLVRAQGYGFGNLEHQVPVHPDTVFEIGSAGMQFTAVALMFLVEDGKIRLDESVRTYLPEAPASWAPITVRNLLNHTSGLPSTPDGEFRRDYTDEELLGIIYKQKLNFPPGVHWNFSYTDYVTLGFLINRVSGEFYGALLARRIFGPLGMRTARLIDNLAIVPNRAAGYQLENGVLRNQDRVSPTANTTADGSLMLSVLDYARWDASLLGRKLLGPQSWAEIERPAALESGRSYPYAFGWYREHSAGQEVWRHSGAWLGFQSFVIHYRGDELTLVALANSDSADPETIVRHVAGMLDPKLAASPGTPIEDDVPQVTGRLRRLLQQIAAGGVDSKDFAFVSRPELAERMADARKTLQSLGELREVALFDHRELGDDPVCRYRARFDRGVLEVNLGYAPDGRVAEWSVRRVSDWNAPLLD